MSRRLREHLSRIDPVMARLIQAVGPYRLRPETATPPFQALARAIAFQQLNGTAARAIFARFVALYAPAPFPTARDVLETSAERLRGAGLSRGKIAALRDLAARVLDGTVPELEALCELSDEEIVERVTAVRGIGRWSVQMMLMFQLGRPDVMPVDDFGVRAGFRLAYALRREPTPKQLAAYAQRWSPWRSAAAWYLWRAVDLAKAGALPPPPVRVRLARVRRRKSVVRKAAKPRARK
jgi:DNA-3-methyladenine glycosylase II